MALPVEPDAMRPDMHRAAQRALSDYIRDPVNAPAPTGIEERRLRIYRELFLNNIENMLAANFPVIQCILAGDRWQALVRDFYRDHPARTPLFTELAREFVRYLEHRGESHIEGDPAWLPELAHYEWLELALQISEARADSVPCDPDGDLLAGRPLLSPLAWPQQFAWPVHRLGPDCQPAALPAEPTWLLLQRDPAGQVRFQQLSALTFRLLQRLREQPQLEGRKQLEALAVEAGAPANDAFIAQGASMLQQLCRDRVLLGIGVD